MFIVEIKIDSEFVLGSRHTNLVDAQLQVEIFKAQNNIADEDIRIIEE